RSFAYDDQVAVHIHAVDRSVNRNGAEKEYGFRTEVGDTTGPVINPYDPYPDQINVPVDAAVHFWVWDSSGVDVDSVFLDIVSDSVNVSHAKPETTKVAGDTVYFRYQPDRSFAYDDQVAVHIHAVDKSVKQNRAEKEYGFRTEVGDTTGPVINPYDPYPDQINVPVDAAVHFWVWDSSGVDIDSVFLDIVSDSVNVSHAKPETTKVAGDTVYFRYQPDRSFAYDDEVTVHIHVADKSLKHNASDRIYSFNTESKPLIDLTISFDKLKKKEIKANEKIKLSVTAKAMYGDCLETFWVCFYLNDANHEISGRELKELKKDDSTKVESGDFNIGVEGKYRLIVKIDAKPFPNGKIEEIDEKNNSDTLEIKVLPDLIVRPNPFTPNDDGINDDSEFDFNQFNVDEPIVRIFDVHGREVRKLDQPAEDKRFYWNGRDSNGKPLLPGMYLYIFSDRDKILARGCVVIVR
ncbi:MAG: gliding motility-associated C-terminal domain-containing protein, partial [candidate division KSB1 bacterium]|nr:gliding motility-associated C-terminal domain-containing protein [candidate division KSB1 bacterium]